MVDSNIDRTVNVRIKMFSWKFPDEYDCRMSLRLL